MMEWFLRLFVWGYLALCTAAIAAALAFLLRSAAKGLASSPKGKAISFLISFLLICGGVAFLGTHPIVTCPPEYETHFTPELRQSLIEHTKGIYSFDLPSPGYLTAVEHIQDGCVRFRTYYLFFGSTVGELGRDGFDLIKPLGKQ